MTGRFVLSHVDLGHGRPLAMVYSLMPLTVLVGASRVRIASSGSEA